MKAYVTDDRFGNLRGQNVNFQIQRKDVFGVARTLSEHLFDREIAEHDQTCRLRARLLEEKTRSGQLIDPQTLKSSLKLLTPGSPLVELHFSERKPENVVLELKFWNVDEKSKAIFTALLDLIPANHLIPQQIVLIQLEPNEIELAALVGVMERLGGAFGRAFSYDTQKALRNFNLAFSRTVFAKAKEALSVIGSLPFSPRGLEPFGVTFRTTAPSGTELVSHMAFDFTIEGTGKQAKLYGRLAEEHGGTSLKANTQTRRLDALPYYFLTAQITRDYWGEVITQRDQLLTFVKDTLLFGSDEVTPDLKSVKYRESLYSQMMVRGIVSEWGHSFSHTSAEPTLNTEGAYCHCPKEGAIAKVG